LGCSSCLSSTISRRAVTGIPKKIEIKKGRKKVEKKTSEKVEKRKSGKKTENVKKKKWEKASDKA
jgi:hypothetical protein